MKTLPNPPSCAKSIRLLVLTLSAAATVGWAQEAGGPLSSGIERANFSKTVKAGDDFYEHVNGQWLETTEIPADQSNYGIFTQLVDESEAAVRTIVEQAAEQNAAAGSEAQKVGDFFKSYLNTERLEELGIRPLTDQLERIDAVKSAGDLAEFMGQNPRRGIGNPFAVFVNSDARQSDRYIVYVTQSGLSLPDRDYYLKDEPRFVTIRKEFREYVEALMKAAGHESAGRVAENVVALETKIAEIHWTRVENRNPLATYNKRTSAQLAELMPKLDWPRFAEQAGIVDQGELVIRQPSFLEGLNKLLEQHSLDTWKDYFTFHIVDAYASFLNREFELLHFGFYDVKIRGVSEQEPRWKRAVGLINGVMGEAVGRLYVERHFKPQAKARMAELVENLKRAFEIRIDKLEWMGPETKVAAKAKLAKFTTKIGYPDEWEDYSKLTIDASDLVGNMVRASAFQYDDMIDKLGGPIDRGEWHMNPQTVNAYYNPSMNEIVFPAAILQPPFFNMAADDAANYGAIGAVIGHEISHGFDDRGSRYDGDGNLKNWWTQADRDEFEKRAKKLVEQYNRYEPLDGMHVNGELTLGENIGDLGGLNVAYTAYQLSLNGKPAAVIDEMTGDQRFFLGWSQIWRRKYREPEMRRRLLTDPHSPSRYRVIGIVSNMDAFYQAFEIEPRDKMYIAPDSRVRIW